MELRFSDISGCRAGLKWDSMSQRANRETCDRFCFKDPSRFNSRQWFKDKTMLQNLQRLPHLSQQSTATRYSPGALSHQEHSRLLASASGFMSAAAAVYEPFCFGVCLRVITWACRTQAWSITACRSQQQPRSRHTNSTPPDLQNINPSMQH